MRQDNDEMDESDRVVLQETGWCWHSIWVLIVKFEGKEERDEPALRDINFWGDFGVDIYLVGE